MAITAIRWLRGWKPSHKASELWIHHSRRDAILAEIDAAEARIAELESRLAEAEALAVWAAKHHASLYHDEPVKHINYWTDERQRGQGESECDGTDADILRALKEAKGAQ